MKKPQTEAGKAVLAQDYRGNAVFYVTAEDIVAIEEAMRVEGMTEGRREAVREVVRESAVAYEAEPPGIDYVTLQVDMDTWAAWKRVAGLNPIPDASESPPTPDDEFYVEPPSPKIWEGLPKTRVGDASESGSTSYPAPTEASDEQA